MSNEYDAVRMQLYGLYKVAKEGRCQDPRPKPDTVRETMPQAVHSSLNISLVNSRIRRALVDLI